MTDLDIRRESLRALLDALGPEGMIRFIQLVMPGSGDYTAERHTWLDQVSEDELWRSIEARRSGEDVTV